ncbi:hypothetical protein, partial [Cysteiniphilum marinum]|uniref:hypothetical protein n=1 Tax=Cysteiniphilum marinum TaxID=2774191 RepID=UPI001F24A4E3
SQPSRTTRNTLLRSSLTVALFILAITHYINIKFKLTQFYEHSLYFESLPKTSTGKVQKFKLKARFN